MGVTVADEIKAKLAPEVVKDAVMVGELIEEIADDAVLEMLDEPPPLRTRKPGLERSALFPSYLGPDSLKRRTYLASDIKELSEMLMVHA